MNRLRRVAAITLVLAAGVGCESGPLEPAPLDTHDEVCALCRMPVSDVSFSSQVVAPGELPYFFDDLACLANFLKQGKAAAGAVAFVADHRTDQWVRAEAAVYTRVPGLSTPMGSHFVAHADAASRDQDALARGGTPVTTAALFGPGAAK